jgi:hypothetical protein
LVKLITLWHGNGMKALSSKKYSLSIVLVWALVFWMIAPSVLAACGCACMFTNNPIVLQDAADPNESSAAPSCCHNDQCKPSGSSGDRFTGSDIYHGGETHPECCCAFESRPQPTVTQSFIKDDYRSSFTEIQFQHLLPSAFMPRTDHFAYRSATDFERNASPLSPHISSTILLI